MDEIQERVEVLSDNYSWNKSQEHLSEPHHKCPWYDAKKSDDQVVMKL